MIKNADGTETEDIISPPKGIFIPKANDYVPPEEDTIPVGKCTDPETGITVRPQGVMVRYAIPASLWEPMGPPDDYVHDDKNPYIYPNYYVHTNEKSQDLCPDTYEKIGPVKGWYSIETAKEWILNELPGIQADFFWDNPRRKYVPDRAKIGTDGEEYWTDEELRTSPAHWMRVNNEGPFIRIFGPEVQAEGFISMKHADVDQNELIDMIKGLGYRIYAEFPEPVPVDDEMAKVEWADTSKWFGPDTKFRKDEDWNDVRGNCYLRHPDYFEMPEHVEFDSLTEAQRWRMRCGLCRDPYRMPVKSEAQLFAEKLGKRRAEKEAKAAAEAEAA